MITLRLDKELEASLDKVAKALGTTKSAFIRSVLKEAIREQTGNRAWELGKNVFGKYGSNTGGRQAEDSESILRARLKANADHETNCR